jgi:hypothetical protein
MLVSNGSKFSTARALTLFAALSAPWIAAHAAPALSGTPTNTVVAAHYYAFQPYATDSSNRKMTFSITGKPSWAAFDSGTGRLYGTPLPQMNVGTYSNITIWASDGISSSHLAPFFITVQALPNNPPRISGTPVTSATQGKVYTFQPTAVDPNGLKIGYGITGKPSWATFDSATGRLTGTPAAANVGTYSNITITAYDGYSKGVLPAFSITVRSATTVATNPVPPPVSSTPSGTTTTGSATLSWTPPVVNSDGSVLGNLSGYKIYFGTAADQLTQVANVNSAGLTRYVISDLAKKTWYFAMTAYNSTGVESARTAVATFTVN